jgi:Protein of unknown function (DUF4232)
MLQELIRFKPTTLAALCFLLLVVAPGVAQGAPSRASAACQSRDVVVWLDTQGDAAAGSTYFKLMFTNIGDSACTLAGFPRVSAVSSVGGSLGSAAGHIEPHRGAVRLLAGDSASATLRIAVAGNFPSATCGKVATAAGLRVSSQDGAIEQVVPFPFAACSHAGPILLTTSALSLR